jgi:hypothetical protein
MRATRRSTWRSAWRLSSTSLLGRDGVRALAACVTLGAVFVLAPLVRSQSTAPTPGVKGEGADLAMGSMLMTTESTGRYCHQRLIDNTTWKIRDGGYVDCAEALSQNAISSAGGRLSSSRIEVLRDGFRNKK